METRANYVLIGAFTLAGFLGLLAFLLWFAKLEVDQQYDYYDVYFSEVSGLSVSSEVRLAGLPVGRVVNMNISRDPERPPVRVRLELRQGTPIRADSVAQLEPQGVTGTVVVGISGGSPRAPLLQETHNPAKADVPEIQASRSVLQAIGDEGPQMVSRLSDVAKTLNEILSKQNKERIIQILTNVEDASANLNKALSDVSDATGSIKQAAEDVSTFGDQLKGLSDAAKVTLDNADTALQQLTETAENADTTLASGTAALDEARAYIAGDLKTLTEQVDRTAEELRSDLAQLTARLDTTLTRVDGVIDPARRMMVSAASAFDGADKVINNDLGPVISDARDTLSRANTAIDKVSADLPDITGMLRDAAQSARDAFGRVDQVVSEGRAPVLTFLREGLPQYTSLARDARGLVGNIDKLVDALRRNPSQILSGPRAPEFRR